MKLLPILSFCMLISSGLLAQKKVLLEKYTSAFCGSCPNGHLEAEALKENYPNLILAFHHSSVDGMANEHSTEWKEYFNVLGTPMAMADRIAPDNQPIATGINQWESRVQNQLAEEAIVDIELNGDYKRASRELSLMVNYTFDGDIPEGDLRLNLMIVEDSVIHAGYGYDQSNYFNDEVGHPLYGLGQPIYFYPHHHVVRDVVDSTFGTEVDAETIIPGVSNQHLFEYYVTYNWDHEYIKLIVFLSIHDENNPNNNEVLNVTEVPLFDFIPTNTDHPSEVKEVLKVHPNPGNSWVRVDVPSSTKAIEIVNVMGQQVFQKDWRFSGPSLQLDISSYPIGTYFIRAYTIEGLHTIPLIKR